MSPAMFVEGAGFCKLFALGEMLVWCLSFSGILSKLFSLLWEAEITEMVCDVNHVCTCCLNGLKLIIPLERAAGGGGTMFEPGHMVGPYYRPLVCLPIVYHFLEICKHPGLDMLWLYPFMKAVQVRSS